MARPLPRDAAACHAEEGWMRDLILAFVNDEGKRCILVANPGEAIWSDETIALRR